MTSPIRSRFDWLAGPKNGVVGVSFAELEMDKAVHLKLYSTLFNTPQGPDDKTFVTKLIVCPRHLRNSMADTLI